MFARILASLLLIAATAAPTAAAAQEKPMKLESSVQLLRPAADDGEAELVDPEGVVPGDTLVFTTSYRNDGTDPVSDFVIVNPVSTDILLSDEAAGQTEVSVDGGMSWGSLVDLKIVDSEGQERPATARDITHIRWAFSTVPPAASGKVQFTATVR